jgi:hypothetical protein
MNFQAQAKLFREFPLSVRTAQRSWIIALAIPLFSIKVLARIKQPWVVQTILGVAGFFALIGFISTCWVVARYPYIGMVDAADGDLYSKYIEKTSTFLKKLLGVLLVFGLGGSLYAPMRDGNITGPELLWLCYGGCTLVFVLFVLFRYNRFDHPAVATLLRCSMGLGILLFPLFLPAIVIGSQRAKRLLNQAQEELAS